MKIRIDWLAVLLLSTVTLGCSAQTSPPTRMAGDGAPRPANKGNSADSADEQTAARQRKIVYQAELALVVEDFSDVQQQVPRLVKDHGGYLAQT